MAAVAAWFSEEMRRQASQRMRLVPQETTSSIITTVVTWIACLQNFIDTSPGLKRNAPALVEFCCIVNAEAIQLLGAQSMAEQIYLETSRSTSSLAALATLDFEFDLLKRELSEAVEHLAQWRVRVVANTGAVWDRHVEALVSTSDCLYDCLALEFIHSFLDILSNLNGRINTLFQSRSAAELGSGDPQLSGGTT